MNTKRVLIAPLNWGLGHAARCVPIVNQLLNLDHEVILASDGAAGHLLQQEFPTLTYIELPSYQIKYPRSLVWLYWLSEMSRLMRVFREENHAINQITDRHSIDFIISDNRYGVYHRSVPSVILTHQLRFSIPTYMQWLAHWQLDKWLAPFDECWVPDVQGQANLSGTLSSRQPSTAVRFIGPLSRMKAINKEVKYDVAVVLSGPEPHRSILQRKLTDRLKRVNQRIAWVLGDPTKQNLDQSHSDIHAFLGGHQLNELLCASEVIISRSGYSSLMDFYQLNKKAILIPTPGQPEQQYLAKRHGERAEFSVLDAKLTNLTAQIEHLKTITPRLYRISQEDSTLAALLQKRLYGIRKNGSHSVI